VPTRRPDLVVASSATSGLISAGDVPQVHSEGELPAWLSVVCADPATRRSVERYLRYLAPGVGHLGPDPVRLVLESTAPEDVLGNVPGAGTLLSRGRYHVARLDSHLVYSIDRQALVRLDPAAGIASICFSSAPNAESDLIQGLVSLALLEFASHRGFFGLHAAAVARDGLGYLLPGASGSGKTSLCLTLVREGFQYLSDDFILMVAGTGDLQCVPFFRTSNLDVAWAERFPELSFIHDLPALAHGKRILDFEQCYPGSHAATLRPTYLLFPRIVAQAESAVRRISRRDAFCRLLPESRLSADLRTAKTHVRMLEQLVHQCEAFELHHGRDFLQAPAETVRALLELLPRDPGG
jgi:hypothetical protein